VTRLGAPFKVVDNDLIPFRVEVAKGIDALNAAIGSPADAWIAADRCGSLRCATVLTTRGRCPGVT
jgi:hypothetical protein